MFSYRGWQMTSWAIKWILEDAERAIRKIYCCWESFYLAFPDFCAFNFIVRYSTLAVKKKKTLCDKKLCGKINTVRK